jgi:hypothetical protein
MHRQNKLSIVSDNLMKNRDDGIHVTYPSSGPDLASQKFWSFSNIEEALYDQRFESFTVKIIIIQFFIG